MVNEALGNQYKIIRNPIPIPALKHVNTYLLGTSNCCIIVDPGLGPECAERITREARCSIEAVGITHFHVDHSTAAAYLEAPLLVGEKEWRHITWMVDTWPRAVEEMATLFLLHGMPRGEVEQLATKHPALSRIKLFQDLVDNHRHNAILLKDGMALEHCGLKMTILDVPGHTPGHIIFQLNSGEVIVGDTVLADITPNIPLLSWNLNPLADYLSSLDRIEALKPRLLLPGHRGVIDKPIRRISELKKHHENRLAEVLRILCSLGKATAYEVAKRMKWDVPFTHWNEFPVAQKFFAHAETLSHLKLLVEQGIVDIHDRGDIVLLKPDNNVCKGGSLPIRL